MKINRENLTLFSIVEEGLMSEDRLGEGRMIPVLVLDVDNNKDIEDLLKVHDNVTSGDVTMTWAQDFDNKNIFILKMEFTKPMEITFGIKFQVDKEHGLIDGILESKGVYLQTGIKGDKISKKLKDPKILVEVPDMGVKKVWNKILLDTIKKKYIKNGYKKGEAISMSKLYISEMRSLWKIRR